MSEDTTKYNNPGYYERTRSSFHGEEVFWCSKKNEKVILPMCYQCHYWHGLKQKCDINAQIPLNKQLDIPINKNDALMDKIGNPADVRKEFKRGMKLARKVA